jgi:TolA-binding protein
LEGVEDLRTFTKFCNKIKDFRSDLERSSVCQTIILRLLQRRSRELQHKYEDKEISFDSVLKHVPINYDPPEDQQDLAHQITQLLGEIKELKNMFSMSQKDNEDLQQRLEVSELEKLKVMEDLKIAENSIDGLESELEKRIKEAVDSKQEQGYPKGIVPTAPTKEAPKKISPAKKPIAPPKKN